MQRNRTDWPHWYTDSCKSVLVLEMLIGLVMRDMICAELCLHSHFTFSFDVSHEYETPKHLNQLYQFFLHHLFSKSLTKTPRVLPFFVVVQLRSFSLAFRDNDDTKVSFVPGKKKKNQFGKLHFWVLPTPHTDSWNSFWMNKEWTPIEKINKWHNIKRLLDGNFIFCLCFLKYYFVI